MLDLNSLRISSKKVLRNSSNESCNLVSNLFVRASSSSFSIAELRTLRERLLLDLAKAVCPWYLRVGHYSAGFLLLTQCWLLSADVTTKVSDTCRENQGWGKVFEFRVVMKVNDCTIDKHLQKKKLSGEGSVYHGNFIDI